MQCARDEFLAGARFAGDEHGHARARQPPDRTEHVLHRRGVSQHLRNPARLGGGGLGALALGGRTAHEFERLVDVEGLRQVLEGAAPVGGDGTLEVGVGRHHDHGQARPLVADLLQQIEAAASGHADVGHEDVRFLAPQRREHRVRVLESRGVHAALLERALEHPADRGVVVDDPDVKRLRVTHGCRTAAGW